MAVIQVVLSMRWQQWSKLLTFASSLNLKSSWTLIQKAVVRHSYGLRFHRQLTQLLTIVGIWTVDLERHEIDLLADRQARPISRLKLSRKRAFVRDTGDPWLDSITDWVHFWQVPIPGQQQPHPKGDPSSPTGGVIGPEILDFIGRYRPTLSNSDEIWHKHTIGKGNMPVRFGPDRPPYGELWVLKCPLGPSFGKVCWLRPNGSADLFHFWHVPTLVHRQPHA